MNTKYKINDVVKFEIPCYGIPAVGVERGYIIGIINYENTTDYIISCAQFGTLIVSGTGIREVLENLTPDNIKNRQKKETDVHKFNDTDKFLLRDFYKMSAEHQKLVRELIQALP